MKRFAMIFGILCFTAPPCFAQESKGDQINFPSPIFVSGSNFEAWGVKAEIGYIKAKCNAAVSVDMPTFTANVQDMVDKGIFSKKVSPTMGNLAPHYLLNIFEAEVAPTVVKSVFDQIGSPETCHFTWSYVNPDEYGNDRSFKMVDFDFLKKTYEKINWPRFNIDNLRKLAINFHGDPQYSADLKSEEINVIMGLKENE